MPCRTKQNMYKKVTGNTINQYKIMRIHKTKMAQNLTAFPKLNMSRHSKMGFFFKEEVALQLSINTLKSNF